MDVQDQSKGSGSNMFARKQSVTSGLFNEPLYSNEDHSLKVRKPYTITKQRERWTDEEHKKFIEALKLYGRAWRRIEEHVGTKTAVQIRSHAQKFFSKVVREINTSSTEPIEIPPPRPKRKPAHPYPRKLIDTPRNRTSVPEQSIGSIFPIESISEHENQSPMSVLSAFCSDTLGSADSNPSNGCVSPASSSAQVKHGLFSEASASINGGLTLSLPEAIDSSPDEQTPESMELFPQLTSSYKEGSEEQVSIKSLKLFGKTVVITDSCKPTFPTTESCKSQLSNIDDKRWSSNLEDTGSLLANTECHGNQLCHEEPGSVYFIQHDSANSNNGSSVLTTPVPRWNPGVQFPFLSLRSSETAKDYPCSNAATVKEAEVQKEGSISGSSNAGPLHENNRCNIGETPCHQFLLDVRENLASPIAPAKSNEKPVLFVRRQTGGMCKQGFVPYKRCVAERDSHSSSIIDSESKRQRWHLCL